MQTKLINALNVWISAYFKDGPDSPTGEATFFVAEDETSADSTSDDGTKSMAQRSSLGASDDSSTELTKAERKAAKKARKALKADLHSARVRRAGGRKKKGGKKGGKKKGKRPGAAASAAKTIDESCQMHRTMKNLVIAIANEIENACNGNRCHNNGK